MAGEAGVPEAPGVQKVFTRREVTAGIRAAGGLQGKEITRGFELKDRQQSVMQAGFEQVAVDHGREAIEALASGNSGFVHGGWEALLKDQIYSDFDNTGKRIARKGTNEETKFREAGRLMRTYVDYLQNGYDNMTGTSAEVRIKQELLRDQVQLFISSEKTLRDGYGAQKPPHAVDRETLENELREEGFRRTLAKVLNDRFSELPEDPARPTPSTTEALENTLLEAKAALKTEQVKKTEHTDRKAFYEKQKKDAQIELSSFGSTADYAIASIPSKRGIATPREAAMATINGILVNTTEPEIVNFRNNLDTYYKLQQQLTKDPKSADLLKRQGELRTSLNEARKDARCREFEQLYVQKYNIQQRISDAAAQTSHLNGEIAKQDTLIAQKQLALDRVATKRHAESGKSWLPLERAVYEAAQQHIAIKAKTFIHKYRTTKETAGQDAAEQNKKQLDDYLDGRWITYRPQSFLHQWRQKVEINGKQAKRDFAALMGTGGADVVIHDSLVKAGVPQEQIALMMENDEFLNGTKDEADSNKRKGGMRDAIVPQVLAAYAVSGGELKKGHLDALALSKYGQNAIQQLDAAKQDFITKIDSAVSLGYTKRAPEDLYERLMKAPKTVPGKILLSALLFPMRLLRPSAIQMGKLIGTIDVEDTPGLRRAA